MSYSASKLLAVEFHYIFFILTGHESSPSDGKKRTDKTQKSTQLAASFLCWKTIIISGLPNPTGFIPDTVSALLFYTVLGFFIHRAQSALLWGRQADLFKRQKTLSKPYTFYDAFISLYTWLPELGQVLGNSYETEGSFFAQIGRKKPKHPKMGLGALWLCRMSKEVLELFDLCTASSGWILSPVQSTRQSQVSYSTVWKGLTLPNLR